MSNKILLNAASLAMFALSIIISIGVAIKNPELSEFQMAVQNPGLFLVSVALCLSGLWLYDKKGWRKS